MPQKITTDFEAFSRLSLGDWVGATGKIVRTRKGELSVQVHTVLLAEALAWFRRQVEGCVRRRRGFASARVDLWANERTRCEILTLRSRLVSAVRRRLEDMGFVEVETPVLHAIPGGALAKPFVTHHNALDADLYLRIAPELYLKRLVVGGFEKVFEIAKGVSQRRPVPTAQPRIHHARALPSLRRLRGPGGVGGAAWRQGSRRNCVAPPPSRIKAVSSISPRLGGAITMAELVSEATGEPVDVHTPVDELRRRVAAVGIEPSPSWGAGKLLLELYEKTTEPNLWGPVFVMDYPAEVSPLRAGIAPTPIWWSVSSPWWPA